MKYVQEAIEKARREREAKAKAGESDARTEGTPALEAAPEPVGGNVDTDVPIYTKTRVLPLNKKALLDNRVVAAFDNDPRGEVYRQLRTHILRKFRDNNWRTLAITSARQGAGKTLTAVNLSIALAKELNQTVLLADMDLGNPDVANVMGIKADVGISDHIEHGVELKDIMINPGLERLVVLPAYPLAGPTSELLSSPLMKATLDEIVHRYDDRLVVFDLPPLLRDDDAMVFTPYVDAVLLVVEHGVTTPSELELCGRLLDGINVIGTVFNKA